MMTLIGSLMMKAILVLNEMPECCEMCYLSMQVPQGSLCMATRKDKGGKMVNAMFGVKPDYCPLKEMPKKKELDKDFRLKFLPNEKANLIKVIRYAGGYSYNQCLDEILGEQNG